MGLLQITGFTENPRGVKIRYKLVQGIETNSHAPMAFTSSDGKVVLETTNGILTADRIELMGSNLLKATNVRIRMATPAGSQTNQ
jgi:hypothetical protein